jgi:hypothetical protein
LVPNSISENTASHLDIFLPRQTSASIGEAPQDSVKCGIWKGLKKVWLVNERDVGFGESP